jgi:uncharacterized protein (DUF58 family)
VSKISKETNWLEDPDLFMAIEDLELVARGVVEGALQGFHRSPYVGYSVEFDSHREYMPGDDLRYVNWNLWSRTDRLYVKQFRSETNLNLYLMLDVSRSMQCDHGPTEKCKYAVRMAASLAFLSLNKRDAAGITILSDRIDHYIPPRVRAGQFTEIVSLLQGVNPQGSTNITQALVEAQGLFKRRGIVLLISDLFDEDEEVLTGLKSLCYSGHDVIVVQVLDPWEAELPANGQFEFEDLETKETIRVRVEQIRSSYQQVFEIWTEGLERYCRDSGIDWLSCRTTDPLRNILIDYLLRRARLR